MNIFCTNLKNVLKNKNKEITIGDFPVKIGKFAIIN